MTDRDDSKHADDEHDDVAVIVAAVDTSGTASRVIEVSARLARRAWNSGQLHVVHVFRAGLLDRPAGGDAGDQLAEEAKHHLEHHVRMAQRLCSAPVSGHFALGNPAEEILRIAASLSADIVVVGTNDSAGGGRLPFGSVAEVVTRNASCSVLIARSKRKRPEHDD